MKNENEMTRFVRAKDKTVSDGERTTYALLSDHPTFQDELGKLRKSVGIPRGGFKDGKTAFEWEHADKKRKPQLWDGVEKLIAKFNVKRAFLSDTKFFIYDFALSPLMVENQLPLPATLPQFEKEETIKQVGRHKIGARLIKTGNDIERNKYQFKTDAIYLEITSETTTRDVSALLKGVLIHKKELRPFEMPKTQATRRFAWQLFSSKKENKMSNAQIAKAVNDKYRMRLTPQHVPSYAGEYEKVLQKLKTFQSR